MALDLGLALSRGFQAHNQASQAQAASEDREARAAKAATEFKEDEVARMGELSRRLVGKNPQEQIPIINFHIATNEKIGRDMTESKKLRSILAEGSEADRLDAQENIFQGAQASGQMLESQRRRAGGNVSGQEDFGRRKEQELRAGGRVARAEKTIESGNTAEDQQRQFEIAKQTKVQSGALEPAKARAASLFTAVGLPGDELFGTNVTNFESFNGVMNRQVLGILATQKGPQTDPDREFIKTTLPRLQNQEDANAFLFDALEQTNRTKIAKRDFIQQWDAKKNTFRGAESAWNKMMKNVPTVSRNIKIDGRPVFFYQYADDVRQAVRDKNAENQAQGVPLLAEPTMQDLAEDWRKNFDTKANANRMKKSRNKTATDLRRKQRELQAGAAAAAQLPEQF